MRLMMLYDLFRSLRFEYRMSATNDPRLGLLNRPLAAWTRHRLRNQPKRLHEAFVHPDTEFVIDGYQGSANSYLVRVFRAVQVRPVRLAHHLHAATAVLEAVDQEIPTLVTLREPTGAALSLVSRWPYVSLTQALRHYTRYYEALEPQAAALMLTPFHATTRWPDRVIEEANRRFGTNFALPPATDPTAEDVRALSEAKRAEYAARAVVKAEKKRDIERPAAQRWLARAEAVHGRLTPYAPPELIALRP